MNNPLITVIIPIYNVEKYLRECLDSVLAQTYTNLEILLVDDGSTDGSGAICDEYAGKDSRIRVIHQENGGLSAARNTGLDAARGEYVSFVDSDDVVGPHFIEVLYDALIQVGVQLSLCCFRRFVDGQPFGKENSIHGQICWSRREAIHELTKTDENPRAELVSVSWNKLYHRSLFEHLRFPVGKLHEDEFVILPLLLQVERVVKCEDVLYFYRQRSESITGSNQQQNPKHLEVLDAFRERCEILHTAEYQDIYAEIVTCYFKIMCLQAMTVAIPCGLLPQFRRRYVRELVKYGRWVQGKRFFLFALSPALYRRRYWK